MKKVLFLYGILIVAVVLLAVTRGGGLVNIFQAKPTATINKTAYNLILAKSDAEKIKGLSGRDKLATNQGMLFVFKDPGMYPFWMKNMKFPIDIIYISNDKIVDIFKNAQPATEDPKTIVVVKPSENANYVLELNAGEATKNNMKKGDTVNLKNVK